MPPATRKAIEANTKMVTVKLLRNYRPMGEHEVVAWDRPEIRMKDPADPLKQRMITVQEAGYLKETDDDGKVKGAPPPQEGVGSSVGERAKDGTVIKAAVRLWKDTIVKLPVDEAKRARRLGIAEVEIDDD